MELGGESDAGAVDFPENVGVGSVFRIGKHEVGSPDQRDIVAAEFFGDDWAGGSKHVDQVLPGFGLVVGVFCAREEGSGEVIAAGGRLLVNHKYRVRANQEDTDFPFDNAGHEPHVDEHAIVTNDVLIAEIHEFAEFPDFGVIVHGLGAAEFSVKRQGGSGG